MDVLLRFLRALQYSRLTRQPRALTLLSQFRGLTSENVDIHPRGAARIRGTNIDVRDPRRHFLLRGIDLVTSLIRDCEARLTEEEGGTIHLNIEDVRLVLENWEELFIAHEIFHEGVYRVCLREPYHVIDVGMNVGTASLAFASDSFCVRVDAYELFPPTYARATTNLALNASLAKKIHAKPYGLARAAREAELDYCAQLKGSTGLHGIANYARSAAQKLNVEKVRVRIEEAGDSFRHDIDRAEGKPVVAKIDCEGAEYEILESLADAGVLEKIAVLLVEWHVRGPALIEAILEKAGFRWLSLHPRGPNHGMIYAWRTTG